MKRILVCDSTLRDGNHAAVHQISAEQVAGYCRMADAAGVPVVEVGHGNGLGASSLQLGESKTPDREMITVARENLKSSKLGIFCIPGFATIEKDLKPAIGLGVDAVRVACHCTEADLTERHLGFARSQGKTAYGVLMMSHMADKELLLDEARKMESYGAEGVILMDSAGASLPGIVAEKVGHLAAHLQVPVGYHPHNNLGMGIANAVTALEAGASILDGCARGFGAGAGNAQLEVLVAVLEKLGYQTDINLYRILDAADWAEKNLIPSLPTISSTSIVSGLSGVFSGFLKPVLRAAKQFEVDPRDIFFELGRRRVVGGQEDLIIEVAVELAAKTKGRA
jgi:4-hydroxy 2-oxovalerate aldolase